LLTSSKSDLEADIRRINVLGDQVRAEGWGFVPMTDAELAHAVRQLRPVLDPKCVILAERDGELIGYMMAMPDVNWALQRCRGRWDWLRLPQFLYWLPRCRRARIFGLGVAPKYRHAGIAGLLIKRLFDEGGERYRAWELSWIDTANIRSIRSVQSFLPVTPYKKYNLYQRPIDSPDHISTSG
jgi:ribosomal protein S18 acetylase RimI-like enzyme